MLTADTSAAKPTYDAPRILGMGIEVSITPNYAEGELHASNTVARRTKRITSYSIKLNTATMEPDMVAYALGRRQDSNGVQLIGGDNVPRAVAIGFVRTRDTGKREAWWIYKGELAEAAVSAKTSSGSIEYQTPSLEGTFDRRIWDNELAVVADEELASVPASVISGWFNAVYEAGAVAEPGANDLPIGSVTAVTALPASAQDATAVYVLTAADGGKASGTMWRWIGGKWEQYGA